MAPATDGRKIAPGDVNVEQVERALRRIRNYLTHTARPEDDVTILGETGSDGPLILPRPTVEMFAAILAALANGQGVQLLPVNAEVSTQTAAEMLNVSRPFLIGLVERGEIPCRLVGRHRRILFNDVIDYKRRDDRRRKDAADALTALDEDLGLL